MIAWAEYADVILNDNSEAEGVAPVIFPHWFHRIRFQCSVCHVELGIKMGAGATGIRMQDLIDGRYCGACHDGGTAWSIDNCDLCHSGKPGLETGVKGGHQTTGPGIY
jgi:c(7)-type cytochrome triheme protein